MLVVVRAGNMCRPDGRDGHRAFAMERELVEISHDISISLSRWFLPLYFSVWYAKKETITLEPDLVNDNFHGKFELPHGLYFDFGFLCINLAVNVEW